MEENYVQSVKQGILDYVLLDPSEQRRLGLHMPEAVSIYKPFMRHGKGLEYNSIRPSIKQPRLWNCRVVT